MTDVDNLKKVHFEDGQEASETNNDHPVMKTEVDDGSTDEPEQRSTHNKEDTMAKTTQRLFGGMSTFMVAVVVVLLGIGSGYGLYSVTASNEKAATASNQGESGVTTPESGDAVKVGTVYGTKEAEAFSDTAQGVMVDGGVEGEGTHRMLRPGGETQTVALTSSIVDLDTFVGHKVKVWGETFDAQRAGWFMDVGRVEVTELDAEKPFEEE